MMDEKDGATGINGRLRPRKSQGSNQPDKVFRKPDNKTADEKRSQSSSKAFHKTVEPALKTEPYSNFLCPYCDKTFSSKQSLSKHIQRSHLNFPANSKIKCQFCNHIEPSSSTLFKHMVNEHPNQYFGCLDCHIRFPSTSALAEHKTNACEKQKLHPVKPYRSKLRRQNSTIKEKLFDDLVKDGSSSTASNFNDIVISCELKPSQVQDTSDIENNITTNLILPTCKNMVNSSLIEKNAVIVLDDLQWHKRMSPSYLFNVTDTDQILSRLGVVQRSARTGESTRRDWYTPVEDTAKFEKCFDTTFYSKVASNVQENLKYLDGTFNRLPNEGDNIIKTRKSKNNVAINTVEGFPILLASEQYSRHVFDGQMPRVVTPKYKWKWDNTDNDKQNSAAKDQGDKHANNCIISLVSSLDMWTQLHMRRKFEAKYNHAAVTEKKTEKQYAIVRELKEILESREIPNQTQSTTQIVKLNNRSLQSQDCSNFPAALGLTTTVTPPEIKPAVLSGEWVRPRCYVCCACGEQTEDSKTLASHIATQHPNAQVSHYEVVGESLMNADILKHLYIPPSPAPNRTRPLRGTRECTKCKKSITLEELHQHMLECAGDTPVVRRKCRYRPFGVRRRRPRLPENTLHKKIRKDMRTRETNQKSNNKMIRTRPRIRTEVGDAETIRKMLADLPAKRHRVSLNAASAMKLRKKRDDARNRKILKQQSEDILIKKKHLRNNHKLNGMPENLQGKDKQRNLIKPMRHTGKSNLIRKTKLKKKPNAKQNASTGNEQSTTNDGPRNIKTDQSANGFANDNVSLTNSGDDKIDLSNGTSKSNKSSQEDSNSNNNWNTGSDDQKRNDYNENPCPPQKVPLKHSIASLTSNSESSKTPKYNTQHLITQDYLYNYHSNYQHVYNMGHQVLLVENEAVVSKLDKPPLLGIDPRYDLNSKQKAKLNKPRKGLNACIAMLKNKLDPVPNTNLSKDVAATLVADENSTNVVNFSDVEKNATDHQVTTDKPTNASGTNHDTNLERNAFKSNVVDCHETHGKKSLFNNSDTSHQTLMKPPNEYPNPRPREVNITNKDKVVSGRDSVKLIKPKDIQLQKYSIESMHIADTEKVTKSSKSSKNIIRDLNDKSYKNIISSHDNQIAGCSKDIFNDNRLFRHSVDGQQVAEPISDNRFHRHSIDSIRSTEFRPDNRMQRYSIENELMSSSIADNRLHRHNIDINEHTFVQRQGLRYGPDYNDLQSYRLQSTANFDVNRVYRKSIESHPVQSSTDHQIQMHMEVPTNINYSTRQLNHNLEHTQHTSNVDVEQIYGSTRTHANDVSYDHQLYTENNGYNDPQIHSLNVGGVAQNSVNNEPSRLFTKNLHNQGIEISQHALNDYRRRAHNVRASNVEFQSKDQHVYRDDMEDVRAVEYANRQQIHDYNVDNICTNEPIYDNNVYSYNKSAALPEPSPNVVARYEDDPGTSRYRALKDTNDGTRFYESNNNNEVRRYTTDYVRHVHDEVYEKHINNYSIEDPQISDTSDENDVREYSNETGRITESFDSGFQNYTNKKDCYNANNNQDSLDNTEERITSNDKQSNIDSIPQLVPAHSNALLYENTPLDLSGKHRILTIEESYDIDLDSSPYVTLDLSCKNSSGKINTSDDYNEESEYPEENVSLDLSLRTLKENETLDLSKKVNTTELSNRNLIRETENEQILENTIQTVQNKNLESTSLTQYNNKPNDSVEESNAVKVCPSTSSESQACNIDLLPKEVVDILGTMPVQHRNTLLNVLPQVFAKTVKQLKLVVDSNMSKECITSPNRTEIATQTAVQSADQSCPKEIRNVGTEKYLLDPVTHEGLIKTQKRVFETDLPNLIKTITTEQPVKSSLKTNDNVTTQNVSDVESIDSSAVARSQHILESSAIVTEYTKKTGTNVQTASLRAVRIKPANEKHKILSNDLVSDDINKLVHEVKPMTNKNQEPRAPDLLMQMETETSLAIQQSEVSSTQQNNFNNNLLQIKSMNTKQTRQNITQKIDAISKNNRDSVQPNISEKSILICKSSTDNRKSNINAVSSNDSSNRSVALTCDQYNKIADKSYDRVHKDIVTEELEIISSEGKYTSKQEAKNTHLDMESQINVDIGKCNEEDPDDDMSLAVIAKQKQLALKDNEVSLVINKPGEKSHKKLKSKLKRNKTKHNKKQSKSNVVKINEEFSKKDSQFASVKINANTILIDSLNIQNVDTIPSVNIESQRILRNGIDSSMEGSSASITANYKAEPMTKTNASETTTIGNESITENISKRKTKRNYIKTQSYTCHKEQADFEASDNISIKQTTDKERKPKKLIDKAKVSNEKQRKGSKKQMPTCVQNIKEPKTELTASNQNSPQPLRRSKRGKCLSIEVAKAVKGVHIEVQDKLDLHKTPVTKKQLIFSKMLIDEENSLKSTSVEIYNEPVNNNDSIGICSEVKIDAKPGNEASNLIVKSTTVLKELENDNKAHIDINAKQENIEEKIENIVIDDQIMHVNEEKHSDISIRTNENHKPDSTKNNSKLNSKKIDKKPQKKLLGNKGKKIKSNKQQGLQEPMEISSVIDDQSTNETLDLLKSVKEDNVAQSYTEQNTEEILDTVERKREKRKSPILETVETPRRLTKKLRNSKPPMEDNLNIEEVDCKSPIKENTESRAIAETINKICTRQLRKARSKSDIKKSKPEVIIDGTAVANAIALALANTSGLAISDKNTTNLSDALNPLQVHSITEDDSDDSTSDVPLQIYVEQQSRTRKRENSKSMPEQSSVQDDEQPCCSKTLDKLDNAEDASQEQMTSERFMENFGFFSKRKPRKSNLLASKKISETFKNNNENDDITPRRGCTTSQDKESKNINVQGSVSNTPRTARNRSAPNRRPNIRNASTRAQRRTTRKAPKKNRLNNSKSQIPTFCQYCKREFRRADNFIRHKMTLFHISKLSQIALKLNTVTIPEKPNCLLDYKLHLDKLRILSNKLDEEKKNRATAEISADEIELSIEEIMDIAEGTNLGERNSTFSRRGLSRDEALFVDCCELLKSHKIDAPAFMVEANKQFLRSLPSILTCPSTTNLPKTPEETVSPENTDTKSEDDMDSVTAKTMLESEEIRNLENELLSGLQEAASGSRDNIEVESHVKRDEICPRSEGNDVELNLIKDITISPKETKDLPMKDEEFGGVSTSDEIKYETAAIESMEVSINSNEAAKLYAKEEVDENVSIIFDNLREAPYKNKETDLLLESDILAMPSCSGEAKKSSKSRKKRAEENLDLVDVFEDKFDIIKRKRRSQAAAAKTLQASLEEKIREKGKHKAEKSKKKRAKKRHKAAILTKGALKGFDGIKVSIPTSEINISAIVPSIIEKSARKKKKSSKKKKERYGSYDTSTTSFDPSLASTSKSSQAKQIDVYEFMDEDTQMIDYGTSGIIERYKSTNKDGPSTSKADYGVSRECNETRVSSASGSYGDDDFVYMSDDYLCSDDETENSLLSCELGSNAKPFSERKKAGTPTKRKDSIEKNAVMEKIFKNNAVRNEKRSPPEESPPTKSNLDLLFDSLFDSEPRSAEAKSPEGEAVEKTRDEIEEGLDAGEGGETCEGGEAGVAQQRARRKCTVGKQNVLAESWSSESGEEGGGEVGGVSISRRKRMKRGPTVRGVRARKKRSAWTSADDEESGHSEPRALLEQHGWIVGDSHKKLVTMLAHAKGRNRDDTRHYVE